MLLPFTLFTSADVNIRSRVLPIIERCAVGYRFTRNAPSVSVSRAVVSCAANALAITCKRYTGDADTNLAVAITPLLVRNPQLRLRNAQVCKPSLSTLGEAVSRRERLSQAWGSSAGNGLRECYTRPRDMHEDVCTSCRHARQGLRSWANDH